MNPVVHFEMPADDRKRMAEFYAKVFGWKYQMLGPEMNDYVTVETTESGKDGRPSQPGSINGGFYPRDKALPDSHPSFVIGVEDIHEHCKKVEEAGGTIISKPMMIPGVGWYASFTDTEGNKVSMLQPTDR